MKNFLIETTDIAPINKEEEWLPRHMEYLKLGYDRGILLCCGPKVPRSGGIIIARADSYAEIDEFLANDPFFINQITTYRIIEFNPVNKIPLMNEWFDGK